MAELRKKAWAYLKEGERPYWAVLIVAMPVGCLAGLAIGKWVVGG